MAGDLDANDVARGLAALAALYVPETVEAGRKRLLAEVTAVDTFASAVAQRLEDLRALDELTRYLHRRSR